MNLAEYCESAKHSLPSTVKLAETLRDRDMNHDHDTFSTSTRVVNQYAISHLNFQDHRALKRLEQGTSRYKTHMPRDKCTTVSPTDLYGAERVNMVQLQTSQNPP